MAEPFKYYGPAVSGWLHTNGRAWETVVTQAGKPLLDSELNLSQDIDGGAAQAAVRRMMPSGWLSDDFLTTSSATDGIFTPIDVPNTIEIPELLAHVNGLIIPVRYTSYPGSTGPNRVDLGDGPAAVGEERTDLVILEVWRRLISAVAPADAATDTLGKSGTGLIWRDGNVKIDPADDTTLNFTPDIWDPNVGSETTKRVQIQYRLRAIKDVDVFTRPYGIDNVDVFANNVPPAPGNPDGIATTWQYVNQSANGDPGLWRAGNGDTSFDLGTVDGYMYALPLLAVFRRNTEPFARDGNQNGGKLSSAPPSDRPDDLFSDIIAPVDLVDLRHGVSPIGWSFAEILEKGTNAILDNSLRTEITHNTYGGEEGSSGTTVLIANEIGGTPNPGVAPKSAEQKFDAVRRRFSDRSIYETMTVVVPPPGGVWNASTVLTVSPSSLAVYPYQAFDWQDYAPDAIFLDVLDAHWAATQPIVDASTKKTVKADPHIKFVTGLGSPTIGNLQISLTVPPGLGLTNESLYLTILVAYPRGVGLTHTPIETYGTKSFALTTGPLSTAAPVYSDNTPAVLNLPGLKDFDPSHREVHLEYQTVQLTYKQGAPSTNRIVLPERASADAVWTVSTDPIFPPGGITLSDSGREFILPPSPTLAPGSEVTVNYRAIRPLPGPVPTLALPQMAVYFRTAAPQMAREAVLPNTLTVIPKLVSDKLLSLTTGSGSQGEAYPFPTAYLQTGGTLVPGGEPFDGDAELAATPEISVANFNSSTGMLNLPTYISMVANPESLVFTRSVNDVDDEGRSYYPGVGSGYIPNAYAQDLSVPDRHKNILPILAELASDYWPLGQRGQLVIILLIRYALLDETNGVYFDSVVPANNSTTASVFRVKGLLLNKRAK